MLAPLGEPEVRVARSQVAYRRRVAFAWTWLPSAWLRHAEGVVVLSIALPHEDRSPRWKEVAHPSPARWMHHLEVRDIAELDEEVGAWLAAAWAMAG
jgi:hypothetical protein